jgi:hypothetical protein
MLSTFQIAAVSAVLSGLVVGTWDAAARTPAASTTKTFVDRVPETSIETGAATSLISAEQRRPTQSAGQKGDRSASAGAAGCDEAAWPYVPQACLHLAGGAEPRTSVRMITVETRQGENTSILMRMPQTTVAAR